MPLDNSSFNKFRATTPSDNAAKWARRRDIPIAILAWIVLGMLIFWALGHVARSIIVFAIAALLAYALTPGVKLLERVVPRVVAIIIVYLVIWGAFGLLLYFIINTTIGQVISLAANVRLLVTQGATGPLAGLLETLRRFGISQSQLNGVFQQIVNQAEGVVGSAVPLITSIFGFIFDMIIVAVLSIYLLVDGSRVIQWLRTNTPLLQRERTLSTLDTFERVIGGYIRGQLLLSTLVGVLVGAGMALFQVPYAVLLGVMAFVLEFVPILGTITSGVICVLLALTKGWLVALLVLAYFVGVHILEGDVLGPRIVGRAVGVHPAVSLIALIAGGELFGIWGAIFASPLAGLVQAILTAVWTQWRKTHPDQFPTGEAETTEEETATKAGDATAPAGEIAPPVKEDATQKRE
jgi:predicted PurR-regulated permease PerM